MDLKDIAQRTAVASYGRIALLEIPSFDERKLLCRMMQTDDIWKNFLLEEPPKPGKLNLEFVNGYLDGFFIRFEPSSAIAGFIVLDTSRRKHEGSVEVVIAVTDPEVRQQRIALEACLALFHHTLDKGYCQSLWAFLDKENFPSEGLIRSLGVTIIDREDSGRRLGREDDHIEVRLTKDEWVQLKKERGLVF